MRKVNFVMLEGKVVTDPVFKMEKEGECETTFRLMWEREGYSFSTDVELETDMPLMTLREGSEVRVVGRLRNKVMFAKSGERFSLPLVEAETLDFLFS